MMQLGVNNLLSFPLSMTICGTIFPAEKIIIELEQKPRKFKIVFIMIYFFENCSARLVLHLLIL